MRNLFSRKTVHKIKYFALAHKLLSAVACLVILFVGYRAVKAFGSSAVETRYVMAAVEKGTLINSVTGSGQVSASNQVDIKSKVSGNVIYAPLKNGAEVKAGTLFVQIDGTDAQKAVRDARTSLETAKLEMEQLLAPPDDLTLLQAENSLIQLKESRTTADDNLAKAKEDGFNDVVNAFFDLPAIMVDAKNILYGNDLSKTQENVGAYFDMASLYEPLRSIQYKEAAVGSYGAAYDAYVKNFDNYKLAGRYFDITFTETLIDETYEDAKKISVALKDEDNFISFVKDTLTGQGKDIPKTMTTQEAVIKTDTNKINSIISGLLSAKRNIKDSRDAIVKAGRSIEEKELSVKKLKEGADTLSIRSKNISIQQKEDALTSALQNLADYSVRAPFEGVLAKINVKKGDSVSSGAAIVTLITKQRIAQLSLNEVDVAKIKVGQKATLTFDAVENLTITGEVIDLDSIGTVTQGVVIYNVKIGFDTEDERVKPGMSVSAAIITDMKQDVLMAPNSAIKSQGNAYYVEVFDTTLPEAQGSQDVTSPTPPKQKLVEVGMTNDTSTEILSGLNEGDQVVSRTVTASTVTAQQAPSLFGGGNARTGGVGTGGATMRTFSR